MSRSIRKETSSLAFGIVGRFGGSSAGFVVAALNAASAASREVVVLRVLLAGILGTRASTTLADFSRARDSQITFSVTHGWSAFWRGRPWLAERRIGETSLAVG